MSFLVFLFFCVVSAATYTFPAQCGPTESSYYSFDDIPEGFKPIFVQVVTRHGHRAPQYCYPVPINVAQTNQLTCTKSFIRAQGDSDCRPKRIFRELKKPICVDGDICTDCLFEQLTSKGYQQNVVLGVTLRNQYFKKLSVDENFSSTDFAIRNTAYERTLSSALGIVDGMFPNGYDEKLITRRADYSTDDQFPNWDLCPAIKPYYSEIDEFFWTTEPIKSRAENVKKRITEILGYEDPDLETIRDCSLSLLCANNLDEQDMVSRAEELTGLPPDVLEEALSIVEELAYTRRSYPSVGLMGRISVGYFLSDLAERLEAFMKSELNVKIDIFAAHDSTIAGILTALEFDVQQKQHPWVPFCSSLVFEVLQSKDEQYFIRLLYNGAAVPIPILSSDENSLVPLSAFLEFCEKNVPTDGECKEGEKTKDEGSVVLFVVLVVLLSILVLVLIAVFVKIHFFGKNRSYVPMGDISSEQLLPE